MLTQRGYRPVKPGEGTSGVDPSFGTSESYTHGMLGTRNTRALVVSLALLASVGLTSCGDEEPTATGSSSSSDPSSTAPSESMEPAPPGTPECSEIWQDGHRVPRFYAGCADEGAYVKREAIGCSSGQRMVTYADRFYAVLGGDVHEATEPLEQDDDYTASVRRCRA